MLSMNVADVDLSDIDGITEDALISFLEQQKYINIL